MVRMEEAKGLLLSYLTGNAAAPHRAEALASQHPILSGYTIFASIPYIAGKVRLPFSDCTAMALWLRCGSRPRAAGFGSSRFVTAATLQPLIPRGTSGMTIGVHRNVELERRLYGG